MDQERLLRIGEVIDRLALSRSTVGALIRSGELPSITIHRTRRVRLSALMRWLDERDPGSADEGVERRAWAPESAAAVTEGSPPVG